MSFPVGEPFFIDAGKLGLAALPEAERPRWEAELRGFVGQEATHRHLHGRFNAPLQAQGHTGQRTTKAADLVAVACGRGMRAPQLGLRALHRARRRTGLALAVRVRRPAARNLGPWRSCFASDFHPSRADDGRGRRWLRDHPAAFEAVRG